MIALLAALIIAVDEIKCDLQMLCCMSDYQDTGGEDVPSCIDEVVKDARRTVLCDGCLAVKEIGELLG